MFSLTLFTLPLIRTNQSSNVWSRSSVILSTGPSWITMWTESLSLDGGWFPRLGFRTRTRHCASNTSSTSISKKCSRSRIAPHMGSIYAVVPNSTTSCFPCSVFVSRFGRSGSRLAVYCNLNKSHDSILYKILQ